MSQVDNLHHLFQMNGGVLTLGQILANWDLVGSKYTCRISELEDELEKKGFTIACKINKKHPAENEYKIVPLYQGQGEFGFKGE